MYKTYHIQKNLNITFQDLLLEYLTPEQIIIPKSITNQLELKSPNVYKDTILLSNPTNLYSPISGKIINITANQIVIENDYMENYQFLKSPRKQQKYTIEEINELLSKYGFSRPQISSQLNCYNIVINAIDDLPYQKNREFYLEYKKNEILEICDILNNSLNPQSFYFVIKNTQSQIIEKYNNTVGSYPFIKYRYLNDEYPLNFNEIICAKLTIPATETLYLTVEELVEMYQIIKRNRPLSEKYITIASEYIPTSFVLNVKIGTKLSDLITAYNLPINEYNYVLNNLLTSKIIDPNNYIITHSTQAIYIVKNNEETSGTCINCGKCNEVCPFGINPLNPKELINCRKCGLCTYFCPLKIKLGKDD